MPCRPHFRTTVLALLLIAPVLSGCPYIEQFQSGLSKDSPAQAQDDSQSLATATLLADSLTFATQIGQMSDEERKKKVLALRDIPEKKITPQERLNVAILALFMKEEVLGASGALYLLEYFDTDRTASNPQFQGFILSLRRALLNIADARTKFVVLHEQMRNELAKKSSEAKNMLAESQSLQEELAAERKKSEEMAQKLQKLLEIEKIMEQRK